MGVSSLSIRGSGWQEWGGLSHQGGNLWLYDEGVWRLKTALKLRDAPTPPKKTKKNGKMWEFFPSRGQILFCYAFWWVDTPLYIFATTFSSLLQIWLLSIKFCIFSILEKERMINLLSLGAITLKIYGWVIFLCISAHEILQREI